MAAMAKDEDFDEPSLTQSSTDQRIKMDKVNYEENNRSAARQSNQARHGTG
jgi:hypothetical protein